MTNVALWGIHRRREEFGRQKARICARVAIAARRANTSARYGRPSPIVHWSSSLLESLETSSPLSLKTLVALKASLSHPSEYFADPEYVYIPGSSPLSPLIQCRHHCHLGRQKYPSQYRELPAKSRQQAITLGFTLLCGARCAWRVRIRGSHYCWSPS